MHPARLCAAIPRPCSPRSQPEDLCSATRVRGTGMTITACSQIVLDETCWRTKISFSEQGKRVLRTAWLPVFFFTSICAVRPQRQRSEEHTSELQSLAY